MATRDDLLNEIDFSPPSAYEAVTRQMVLGLRDDVAEIKNRVNSLFWLIAGTVVLNVLLRLFGVGE
jgi:hypothetical protein